MRNYRKHIAGAMIAIFVAVPFFWFLLDRAPPYEIELVDIAPDPVRQGDDINITFTIRASRLATCGPGVVYREFKEEPSGKLHVFDPVQRASPPTVKDGKFTRTVHIPNNISVGRTTYRAQTCYSCNPLQSWLRWPVCVAAPGTQFNVIARETGKGERGERGEQGERGERGEKGDPRK